ncbi:MAG: dockerin type I repeat-containing protein [Porcipelethomonas sp.]
MKKFTKCLAVLSSAIMVLSAGVLQTSAAFEEKVYDTTRTNQDGSLYPYRVTETMQYMGVIFKVPGETVPTAEELGIDGVVKKYIPDDGLAIALEKIDIIDGDWEFEYYVTPEENHYTIQTDSIMTEEEAEKLAEKLVVRGVAEEAGVWYRHGLSKAYIGVDSYYRNSVDVFFKNEEDAEKFSFEKYPEIKEILKYNEYSNITVSGSRVTFSCDAVSSDYNDAEKNTFDYMGLYNDVKSLNDTLTSKYDEIEMVDLTYYSDFMERISYAVYSAEPTWGDATNDDVINLYDAIEISKYIMNISGIDEETVLLADINRDGKTDIYDAIEVAKCIMEK